MSEEKYPDHPYADAIEEVHYRFSCFTTTKDELNKAHHLIEMANAVSDLVSFHPGYQYENGTMPWEREDDV